MNKYFVNYNYYGLDDDSFGSGSFEHSRENTIQSIEDIRVLEKDLNTRISSGRRAVITGWQRFEQPEPPTLHEERQAYIAAQAAPFAPGSLNWEARYHRAVLALRYAQVSLRDMEVQEDAESLKLVCAALSESGPVALPDPRLVRAVQALKQVADQNCGSRATPIAQAALKEIGEV